MEREEFLSLQARQQKVCDEYNTLMGEKLMVTQYLGSKEMGEACLQAMEAELRKELQKKLLGQ